MRYSNLIFAARSAAKKESQQMLLIWSGLNSRSLKREKRFCHQTVDQIAFSIDFCSSVYAPLYPCGNMSPSCGNHPGDRPVRPAHSGRASSSISNARCAQSRSPSTGARGARGRWPASQGHAIGGRLAPRGAATGTGTLLASLLRSPLRGAVPQTVRVRSRCRGVGRRPPTTRPSAGSSGPTPAPTPYFVGYFPWCRFSKAAKPPCIGHGYMFKGVWQTR